MVYRCQVPQCTQEPTLFYPNLCPKHFFGSRISIPEKSDKSPETKIMSGEIGKISGDKKIE